MRVVSVALIMFVCLPLTGSCASSASSASTFVPETNQDLLPLIIQGTHNAYASVVTGMGQVVVTGTQYFPDGKVQMRWNTLNDIAFSGDKLKHIEKRLFLENNPPPGVTPEPLLYPVGSVVTTQVSYDGNEIVHYSSDNGKARVWIPGPRDVMGVTRLYQQDVSIKGHRGIVDLSSYGQEYPKDKFQVTAPKVIGREVINGDECIVVAGTILRPSDGVLRTDQYWINTAKGFVASKVQQWLEGAEYKEKALLWEESTEFRRCDDGVWAPASFSGDSYKSLPLEGVFYKLFHVETTYDPGFHVNVPVSDNDCKLALASGTAVRDDVLGEDYIVP